MVFVAEKPIKLSMVHEWVKSLPKTKYILKLGVKAVWATGIKAVVN